MCLCEVSVCTEWRNILLDINPPITDVYKPAPGKQVWSNFFNLWSTSDIQDMGHNVEPTLTLFWNNVRQFLTHKSNQRMTIFGFWLCSLDWTRKDHLCRLRWSPRDARYQMWAVKGLLYISNIGPNDHFCCLDQTIHFYYLWLLRCRP